MSNDDFMATAMTALKVQADILAAKPAKGDTGETVCPKCGGTIKWWYGGPRAFRASCSTPHCLAMMS